MTEFNKKHDRIRALLEEHRLDALLLQRVSSFAWATCGAASYVNTATTEGAAALLITRSDRHLITNNIEATRLEREEGLAKQGWIFHTAPWYETHAAVAELAKGLRLGGDGPYAGATDLTPEVARLRSLLTAEEGARFRELARLCAEAMDAAARAVCPGLTEHRIAGLLAQEAESRGVQAIVNLIATDSRIFAFRHPLPTHKTLERYAMLVLCGRRWGLVCSITRLVHFGPLPSELRRKAEAVARVDATLIASTSPGRSLGEVFEQAKRVYAETGFPDEWHHHHQGGPAGYEPREAIAIPASGEFVAAGQVYAWNPSIRGAKSEDTILVSESGQEILTAISGWPTIEVFAEGQTILRPSILELR